MEKKFGKQAEWNNSYLGGGNMCFYPHEEIIRFVNKYIRKRDGIHEFHNVMDLPDEEWMNFKSLDLGCGIGRHVKFLDEFGLNPFGIDLSDTAISIGRNWFQELERADLAEKLTVGSVTDLPYEDETFWMCVSHGTLDSMARDIAQAGIKETARVLKKNGLMYLDLIMDVQKADKEVVVEQGYEKGTIQSYFNVDSIKQFLGDELQIIEFKIIAWKDEKEKEINRRAHIIVKKKAG